MTEKEIIEKTPDWNLSGILDKTATSVTITTKILCYGRGLTRKDIATLCYNFEKLAQGRSKEKDVSAIC